MEQAFGGVLVQREGQVALVLPCLGLQLSCRGTSVLRFLEFCWLLL